MLLHAGDKVFIHFLRQWVRGIVVAIEQTPYKKPTAKLVTVSYMIGDVEMQNEFPLGVLYHKVHDYATRTDSFVPVDRVVIQELV